MINKINIHKNLLFVITITTFFLLINYCSYKSHIKHEIKDNKIQEEISVLEDSLRQNPKDKELNLKLAEIYFSTNNYRVSDHFISKAIEIDTNYHHAYFLRAEVYEGVFHECEQEQQDKELTFEDKLFYRLIYENYKISSNSNHLRDQSLQRMENLWPLVDFIETIIEPPIKKIKFFDKCYKWVIPEIKSRNLVYYITENKFSFRPK
jgi:tetratricopeptide (TPR) repeat protein